jgi:hypothetical protein
LIVYIGAEAIAENAAKENSELSSQKMISQLD